MIPASAPQVGRPSREGHGEWVRLRTLSLIRWTAIAGQIAAIFAAILLYDIDLDLGLCSVAVGAAVLINLVTIFVFPESTRLTETGTMLMLLFDIAQIAFLLFVTGGLNNPFALLILGPTTIAASALQTRSTVILGLVSIGLVTALAFLNLPLRTLSGTVISVPPIFAFGYWLAIVIGIVFLGLYARRVASEIHSMADALLATQMALDREQKLTDLGGVVAAAAHELGTPLATIKLVSAELADDLADRPLLREDVDLIRSQADRCAEILRSMGRAGKDDLLVRTAPLTEVVREAAEPHAHRGKSLIVESDGNGRVPTVVRRPEIIHGLRNLVQNAVDFAASAVWIDIEWSETRILIRIADNGAGYPAHLIGRIGDPFVRNRRLTATDAQRPEYEGMGLGLFIAKTLLERMGAQLSFLNGADPFLTEEERPERCGAIVEVEWPRAAIEAPEVGALGENRPFPL